MTLKLAPRLLAAAWIGVVSYCLFSILLGPGGLLASREISSSIAGMRQNLASLRSLNADLTADVAALGSDPDRIRLEARPLGWLGKNEYELVITGRPPRSKPELDAGKVLSPARPQVIADTNIKAIALLFGIVAFAAGMLRSGAEAMGGRSGARRRGIAGSPARRAGASHKGPSSLAS